MGALNEACRSNGGKIKTVIHHMCVGGRRHLYVRECNRAPQSVKARLSRLTSHLTR